MGYYIPRKKERKKERRKGVDFQSINFTEYVMLAWMGSLKKTNHEPVTLDSNMDCNLLHDVTVVTYY